MEDQIYPVKRISFFEREVPICLQNENGPCPLLAISNVLLLRGDMQLRSDVEVVTPALLLEHVANIMLERGQTKDPNWQHNLHDVLPVLPTLIRGLDVNVKFAHVTEFEFDSRIAVFDILNIRLVHGWVIDPQDKTVYGEIGSQSYNQLLDELLSLKSPNGFNSTIGSTISEESTLRELNKINQSPILVVGQDSGTKANGYKSQGQVENETMRENEQHESVERDPLQTAISHSETDNDKTLQARGGNGSPPVVGSEGNEHGGRVIQLDNSETLALNLTKIDLLESFLESTASQLTYAGLLELHEVVRDRELCVLFRNNHFISLFKKDGQLFQLLTDLGYKDTDCVAWELLNSIDGDTEIVSPEFGNPSVYNKKSVPSDELLAAQLQQDEDSRVRNEPNLEQDRSPVNQISSRNETNRDDCVLL